MVAEVVHVWHARRVYLRREVASGHRARLGLGRIASDRASWTRDSCSARERARCAVRRLLGDIALPIGAPKDGGGDPAARVAVWPAAQPASAK